MRKANLSSAVGWALVLTLATPCALAQTVDQAGHWTVTQSSSELDNSKRYLARLGADNHIPNSIGAPDTAALIVRCQNKNLEVYIVWPPFMGTDDVSARYKFDQGPIMKQLWTSSEDGTATFIPHPRDFLAGLASATKFVADAAPYQQDNAEVIFDVTGAAVIVSAAEAACPA